MIQLPVIICSKINLKILENIAITIYFCISTLDTKVIVMWLLKRTRLSENNQ